MRRAAAWLIVVPWVLWAIVRVLGIERGYPMVQLMAFTPYVVPLALFAALLAAGLRHWAPAGVAVAAAVTIAALVAPRALGDASPSPRGPQLRVLTANAHLGQVPPQDLVALARRDRADVLAVQELTPGLATGLERAGILDVLPHAILDTNTDAWSGLYSRRPLRWLPEFRGARSAMESASLTVPGAPPVRIISVHTAVPIGGAGVAAWRHDLGTLPPAPASGPLRVLAGDFNATLDHDELRALIGRGYRDAGDVAGAGLHPTWHGVRVPPVTLDHVLLPRRAGVVGYATHTLARSDHRAVLAVLALPAA